jgi:6-phosphogluconolactonase
MSVHAHTYPSAQEAAAACARHILLLVEEALSGEHDATLAISGGSTPSLMFDAMAAAAFSEWKRVQLFWVDERAVPPTDPQSNYRLALEHLIQPVNMPLRNVHRICAELKPEHAAARYVDELREHFNLAPGEVPHFDVIHRGMGPDAHTASLFPGEKLIEDRERLAAAVWVDKMNSWRITMLPAVLMAAQHTAMLVSGDDKVAAVRHVFEDQYDPLRYPAQMATHHGRRVTWFMDEAAARGLDPH